MPGFPVCLELSEQRRGFADSVQEESGQDFRHGWIQRLSHSTWELPLRVLFSTGLGLGDSGVTPPGVPDLFAAEH